jgi:hypothetical protein
MKLRMQMLKIALSVLKLANMKGSQRLLTKVEHAHVAAKMNGMEMTAVNAMSAAMIYGIQSYLIVT